jgi:epoxyqueuosine reductase
MYNEQPEPFPDWIELNWHNCLVGCLRCQIVCPHNRHNKHPKEIIETFNIEETRLILDQIPFDQLPINLKEKLNHLCLNIYYDKLSRNLTVLYQKSKNKG